MKITDEQIKCALLRIKPGLEKYQWLQSALSNTIVSSNREFQKRFNHFYRIRRNSEWQKHYYKLLQKHKDKAPSFKFILQELQKRTGYVEASFSSKLVATIDSEKPVIDKFVLENANLVLPYPKARDRIDQIVQRYIDLEKIYENFLKTPSGESLVSMFKAKFPDAGITDIKMADLVFWQTRPNT